MRRFDLNTLSDGTWKVLVCCVALFMATLLGAELWYAPQSLAADSRGTLGIQYHELHAWGRSRFVIDQIAPESPLRAAGAEVGDVWFPDRTYDAYRWLGRDESIGLTLVHVGEVRHLTVQTLPTSSPVVAGALIESWVAVLIGLFLGLLVGLRQPHGRAFRALALTMFFWCAGRALPTYLTLPAGNAFFLQHLVWGPVLAVTVSIALIFFFNYPDDRPSDTALKRRLLRYGAPVVAAGILVFLMKSTARALGYYLPPSVQVAYGAMALPALVVVLAILWSNWRHSTGELRERHFWIGLAFGLIAPAGTLATIVLGIADEHIQQVAVYAPRTIMLLGFLLLVYAVLRHRVVSTSFAINRAAVYGVASLGMVLSFALVEWFTHNLLAAWGHEQSPYIDAGIALAIILVFHRLRHGGEQWVERLFFHSWHMKEAALQKFITEAPYITRIDALRDAFATALDRFTGGAPHAFYRRLPSGDYTRGAATLTEAPGQVDADDPLTVTMRTTQAVTYAKDTASTLPAEIALPSIHHGELDGFVLLGPKPRNEPYRPDELEVLGVAAHRVGLDFRALRMEQLERDVANSQMIIAELRLALQRGN
jgi:hypothetical protein